MIQDIGKDIYQVEYKPEDPKDQDVIFLFQTRRVFAKMDETKNLYFPTYAMLKDQMDKD